MSELIERVRDMFALSLSFLILYFHFGFPNIDMHVLLIGAVLTAAVFIATVKYNWEEKLPDFRTPRERIVFFVMGALFLIGQLYFLAIPYKLLLAFNQQFHLIGTLFEIVVKWGYVLAVVMLAVGGWYALTRLFLLVWRQVETPVCNLLRSLDRFDGVLLFLGVLFLGMAVVVSFHSTNLFYYPCLAHGDGPQYDVLFTGDSRLLSAQCSWINLFSSENDFRQMLYALCSLHLLLFHLPAYFLPLESFWRGVAYALPQLVFLEGAFLLLVRLMRLERWDKVVFFLLLNSTFPTWLFALMQEQYVIAVFFLLLFLLLRRESGAEVLLVAAGGTLSTSVLALFLAPGGEWKQRWKVFYHALIFGGAAMILTSQWRLISVWPERFFTYQRFMGGSVPFPEKLEQYFHFLAGCFVAPKVAQIGNTLQLVPVSGVIAWGGIIVAVLLLCGFLLNWRDDRARLCFNWLIFSVFLLLIVGWGSAENGMILYSLYFQWAFCGLVWLLAEKVFGRFSGLRRAAAAVAAVGLLAYNLPAMWAIWQWGVVNYPAIP